MPKDSSHDFTFTEKMIGEAKVKEKKAKKKQCCNPLPNALENIDHVNTLTTWDIWLHLVPILKRELGRRSPERLSKNKGKPLFKLTCKDSRIRLHILQEWAAEKLELPDVYIFKHTKPIDAYTEIVCRFICS